MRAILVAALAALAASWLLTHSETVQFAVLLAFALAVRRFADGRDAPDDRSAEATPPWRVFGLSLVLLLPWGVAVFFLSGWIDLRFFWPFAFLWPLLEVQAALVRRDADRYGTDHWKPEQVFPDAVIAALITIPLITAIAFFLGDASLPEALAGGAACGLIVFAMATVFIRLDRRSRSTG
ncbi:MAG TPA: hypothetical protein VHF88_09185 [Thermoleophilaceae bacterium]|nr:hypothetical protein [Thermoleophilaceae bacterium]